MQRGSSGRAAGTHLERLLVLPDQSGDYRSTATAAGCSWLLGLAKYLHIWSHQPAQAAPSLASQLIIIIESRRHDSARLDVDPPILASVQCQKCARLYFSFILQDERSTQSARAALIRFFLFPPPVSGFNPQSTGSSSGGSTS